MQHHSHVTLSLEKVQAARARLQRALVPTPCTESPGLSELTGSQIFCKREYLQRTGSFKERGARHALQLLAAQGQRRGVIAASAGNHAQGLAWHGRELGIPVTVVMPQAAPLIKVRCCRRFGAQVLLHGETFDQARAHALRLAEEHSLHLVHPFDDLAVVAGQGTLGLEVLEQVPGLDAVLVPVGGGGLLAGVATVLRALQPKVQIIGVEPENAASFSAALRRGRPVSVPTRSTLADGLAVAEAGHLTFDIAARLVDQVVTVREDEIARAILHLAETERAVVEGAGAVGLAALLSGRLPGLKAKRVALVLSGGNIDLLTLSRVIETFGRSNSPLRPHPAEPWQEAPPAKPIAFAPTPL